MSRNSGKQEITGWHIFVKGMKSKGVSNFTEIKRCWWRLLAEQRSALNERAKFIEIPGEKVVTKDGLVKFNCDACGQLFTKRKHLTYHSKHCKTSGSQECVCTFCGKHLASPFSLKRHQVLCFKKEGFDSVKFQHDLLEDRWNHISQETGTQKCVCSFCGKHLASPFSLKRHQVVCSRMQAFESVKLEHKLLESRWKHLMETEVMAPGLTKYSCCNCDYSSHAKYATLQHIKQCILVYTKNKCSKCSQIFESKKELVIHLMKLHDDFSMVEEHNEAPSFDLKFASNKRGKKSSADNLINNFDISLDFDSSVEIPSGETDQNFETSSKSTNAYIDVDCLSEVDSSASLTAFYDC